MPPAVVAWILGQCPRIAEVSPMAEEISSRLSRAEQLPGEEGPVADQCRMIDPHTDLGAALAPSLGLLSWSQGTFGPRHYARAFLETYTNAMLSSLWSPCGLEVGLFFLRRGTRYPLHRHVEKEVYYVVAGRVTYFHVIEGQLVGFERGPGDWHYNPPDVPHTMATDRGEDHLCLWIRQGSDGQAINDIKGPIMVLPPEAPLDSLAGSFCFADVLAPGVDPSCCRLFGPA